MVTTKDIMSGNTTRTIVITTSSGNVPKLVTVNASAVEDIFSDDGGGPRKRRRLTNLTPEEKMLRRKLKNRVAAQTARDRKKELMGTLEQQVTRLMDQNKRLQDENKKLKTQSSSLITENQHLKERLGQPGSLAERKSESSGSAVSFDLLPWGTNSEVVSVNDAIRNLCSDNESLLSIVQQISSKPDTDGASRGSDSSILTAQGNTPKINANSGVVGPTSAELESINELIKFDHVYYKHESSSVETGLEKPVVKTNSQTKVNVHITQEIPTEISIEESVKTEPELSAIDMINETDLNDINLELLKDIENLIGIDFQDQIEQDSFDSISQNGQCVKSKQEVSVTKDTSLNRKRKRSEDVSPLSVTDMYESTDKLGQETSIFKDSEFGSDFSDVCSPYGSDISGDLNDNPWEESFMELFPTLA